MIQDCNSMDITSSEIAQLALSDYFIYLIRVSFLIECLVSAQLLHGLLGYKNPQKELENLHKLFLSTF